MKKMIHRLLAAVAAIAAFGAAAQEYPTRPIHLVVPFSAGGPTDLTARAVALQMGNLLGQQVIVENRTGAGAILASDYVAKAPPDGHVILFGTFSMAISHTVYPKLPYDTLTDFAPIGTVANSYLVLATPANSPVRTLRDFTTMVKMAPQKFNYGSAGVGSGMHLASEMFLVQAGLQGVTHIPYRGNSLVIPALVAGDVNYSFLGMDSALPHIKSGKLRAIAVTSPERDPQLPDVPTIAESGYPGFDIGVWFALEAPKNTPPAIVNKLNDALNRSLKTAAMQEMSRKFAGLVMMGGSTPQSTDAFIRNEITRWAPIVRAAGVKPE